MRNYKLETEYLFSFVCNFFLKINYINSLYEETSSIIDIDISNACDSFQT